MLNNFNSAAGLPPTLRNAFTDPGLPPIRGKWHFVDPNAVNRTSGAFTNLYDAYNACVDERGDGIALVSSGNSTAETTSYMTYPLDWTKEGITMYGICAPSEMFQRARIASKQVTTGSITTLAFPTTTTITDSDSGFLTAGFAVGQTIVIATNDGTNDGNAIITAVTAGTITCSASTFTVQTATVAGASTLTNYMAYMIDIQASNVYWKNLSIGNWLDTAQDLGCVKVSAARTAFHNVHFVGGGGTTSGGQAGAYDVMLNGAQEFKFKGCVFGTDSVAKAAANGEVVVDGGCWRGSFEDCRFVSQSATSGKGAIKSADATSFSGIIEFVRCRFHNWNPNGITAVANAFIGTDATSGDFAIDNCSTVGYTAIGAGVYNAMPTSAASAAGGISTTE